MQRRTAFSATKDRTSVFLSISPHQEWIVVCSFERQAGASGNGLKRIFGHTELDIDFLCEPLGEAAQKGAATCKPDAVAHNIRLQLRRSALQDLDNLALNL